MAAKLVERRRGNRVNTALPVILENARGIIRDISASGAFFWTSGKYAIGESISFAIELTTPGGRMMWKCRGDIIRTEPRGTDVGVAVRITEAGAESKQT